jgi:hypothetical protein
MRFKGIFGIAAVLAILAGPVAAQDAMQSGNNMMSGDNNMMSGSDSMMSGDAMGMMENGEVMTFMPDGHMGKAMVSADEMGSMMQMATPLDHCVMIITGPDGKTYMVDTSSGDAMAACEKMAM